MTITFDPGLREDLNRFLIHYGIENVAETPVQAFAEMDFPRSDKIGEHKSLNAIVARLLRLKRFVRKRTRLLDRMDEQDLVRATLDPELGSWWATIGSPALVRLGMLDCRERLVRLAWLAEEARECHAVERLIARRADEPLGELGKMQALLSWLDQEIDDIASLTNQIPDMPRELLPQPAWGLFLSLRQQMDRLGLALMDLGLRGENPEFYDASFAKREALEQALGELSEYDGLLYYCDPVDETSGNAIAVKYSWVRKALEMGVEHLSVNQELLAHDFLFDERIESSIEEAFRLTDRDNALWDFIGTDFFRPDDWRANREALKPLLLKQPQHIERELRRDLMELAHAFVVGHWISVQALSRAILERAVKITCMRGKFAVTYSDDGKARFLLLYNIIEQLGERYPDIKGDMNFIRGQGNAVLHPEPEKNSARGDGATDMIRLRDSAIQTVEALYRVLEALPKLAL